MDDNLLERTKFLVFTWSWSAVATALGLMAWSVVSSLLCGWHYFNSGDKLAILRLQRPHAVWHLAKLSAFPVLPALPLTRFPYVNGDNMAQTFSFFSINVIFYLCFRGFFLFSKKSYVLLWSSENMAASTMPRCQKPDHFPDSFAFSRACPLPEQMKPRESSVL